MNKAQRESYDAWRPWGWLLTIGFMAMWGGAASMYGLWIKSSDLTENFFGYIGFVLTTIGGFGMFFYTSHLNDLIHELDSHRNE